MAFGFVGSNDPFVPLKLSTRLGIQPIRCLGHPTFRGLQLLIKLRQQSIFPLYFCDPGYFLFGQFSTFMRSTFYFLYGQLESLCRLLFTFNEINFYFLHGQLEFLYRQLFIFYISQCKTQTADFRLQNRVKFKLRAKCRLKTAEEG